MQVCDLDFFILKLFDTMKSAYLAYSANVTYEDGSPLYISKKKVRAAKNFIKDKMT